MGARRCPGGSQEVARTWPGGGQEVAREDQEGNGPEGGQTGQNGNLSDGSQAGRTLKRYRRCLPEQAPSVPLSKPSGLMVGMMVMSVVASNVAILQEVQWLLGLGPKQVQRESDTFDNFEDSLPSANLGTRACACSRTVAR